MQVCGGDRFSERSSRDSLLCRPAMLTVSDRSGSIPWTISAAGSSPSESSGIEADPRSPWSWLADCR